VENAGEKMNRFFLPMSRFEMDKWGWDELDVILITGDAFIDHPYFAIATLSRLLKREEFRVGIIAQPNPLRDMEFAHLGKPRLFFGVTAGHSDSMVANYSAENRRRKYDNYTPGRIVGKRADRATAVYSQTVRRLFPDTPVINFGLEATMRRLVHFDYWDNEVKKSVLADADADLLIYGTGERQILEVARRLDGGEPIQRMTDIKGTCWRLPVDRGNELKTKLGEDFVHLPSFEQIYIDRDSYLDAFKMHQAENDPYTAKPVVQEHPADYVIQNPPQLPLSEKEMDEIYDLDFIRTPHPRYKRAGPIPIFETIKFTLATHRGCFAGCSFCSIPQYHGRYIQSRSKESIMKEADLITGFHYFRGWISNIGGPTGNMWKMSCRRLDSENVERCDRESCTYPEMCEHLNFDHSPYIDLINEVLDMPIVEKAYIATGLRYDMMLQDPRGKELLDLTLSKLIQVNMKFAPEHVAQGVCKRVCKYTPEATQQFIKACNDSIEEHHLSEVILLPYFISGHPGSGYNEAIEVAQFMKRNRIEKNKVHDFVPSPMVPSTCMYFTGQDPERGDKVYRPLAFRERKLQRAILNYFKPQNQRYVFEGLQEAQRTELIGDGPDCILEEEPEVYRY
jgi:uncharacterized radical SAM protein YgiQ